MVDLRPSKYTGVLTDERDFFTPNLVPGVQVYGEKLLGFGGREYRRWNPHRSKLAALMHKGSPVWPFNEKTDVLYLGAASGTTASHISDICTAGRVFCVEISPRVFRKLLDVAALRANMTPFLGDASHPETYRKFVSPVDVVYQDIAQRDQVSIYVKNTSLLKPGGHGFLVVKARSIDVAAKPTEIFRNVERELTDEGVQVLGTVNLDPFEKDHAVVVVSSSSEQA